MVLVGKREVDYNGNDYKGNCLRIELSAEENNVVFTMPDGYSYESFLLTEVNNLNYINPVCRAIQGGIYNFPPDRSKSPNNYNVGKA